MNERRQDVCQLPHSNSNQSASNSLTSLETVVLAASTATVDKQHRACSLPSSTSTSSTKSISSVSPSPNASSIQSSSSTISTSSYYSSSYSYTEDTSSLPYSCSSSSSTSPCAPSATSAKMSLRRSSSSDVKQSTDLMLVEGATSTPSGVERKCGESLSVTINEHSSPPPIAKKERKEGSDELTMNPCCCCCSWQSVALEPVVLVACGSFNPITTMHLRMMELAREAVEKTWSFHQPSHAGKAELNPRRQIVVAGILSPVSDAYKKASLASAVSRCRLARLACAATSDWLAVDSWEASRDCWTPTRYILEHIQSRMDRIHHRFHRSAGESAAMTKTKAGTDDPNDLEDPRFGEVSGEGVETYPFKGSATNAWLAARLQAVREAEAVGEPSGRCCCGRWHTSTKASVPLPPIRIKFVCGADLLQSFATPELWSEDDMTSLARDHGIVCISRPGSNTAKLIYELDILSRYEQNVILATEWCQNGLSATLVRRALARGQSVRYLVPDAALEEIYALGLYGTSCPRPQPPPRLVFVVPPQPTNRFQPLPSSSSSPDGKEIEAEVETGTLHRRLQRSIKCATVYKGVTRPETLERGTNPLKVETRCHSVQTCLSSPPSPEKTSSAVAKAHSSGPLILHRVIMDPDVEKEAAEGSDNGLTAILPLLKQCTRCGSQRVRLLLVERPPPKPKVPSASLPVVHTLRHHHQQQDKQPHRPQLATLPRMSQAINKSTVRNQCHLLHQQQQQRPHFNHLQHPQPPKTKAASRLQTQPITLLSGLGGKRALGATSDTMKLFEQKRRNTLPSRKAAVCPHHSQTHCQHYISSPPMHLSQRPRQKEQHFTTSKTASKDVTNHQHHLYSAFGKPISQRPSVPATHSTAFPRLQTPTEPFQHASLRQLPRQTSMQRPSRHKPYLQDDSSGAAFNAPHFHPHRSRHLTPPAVEAQPAPPPLTPRASHALSIATTTATSLSQPLLTQRSAAYGPRHTHDEVDCLLYNLCLNIESAL